MSDIRNDSDVPVVGKVMTVGDREEYPDEVYSAKVVETVKPSSVMETNKLELDVDGGMLRIKLKDSVKELREQRRVRGLTENIPAGIFVDTFLMLGIDYDIELLDSHGNPMADAHKITAIKFEFTARKKPVNITLTFEE